MPTKKVCELNPDRLLHDFRRLAGLEPKAPVYEGWESMGLAGLSFDIKNRVTIRFEAQADQEPGRVYGCRMLDHSAHIQ